jgi:hypothetical protein
MATNLPGAVGSDCIIEHNACLLRVAKLDSDCSPTGGADSGVVSAAIVSATVSPEVVEGEEKEAKNGCGRVLATVTDPDVIKRYNITALDILTQDVELKYILFGGQVITGKVGGSYAGENIGWASPGPDTTAYNGVYLEIITQAFAEGAGDCATSAGGHTPYVGHIFGKVKLVPGDRDFGSDIQNLTATGKAFQNPNLFDGPWNDWPAVGYIKNSPYQWVGYSQSQYDAMLAVSGCGYVTLPAAS